MLELLTEKKFCNIIKWCDKQGEFKFVDKDEAARLWGEVKKKPNMNYYKMTRSIRHYYDNCLITKVFQKKHTYKFHESIAATAFEFNTDQMV